jgi:zinc and cadmium transporter
MNISLLALFSVLIILCSLAGKLAAIQGSGDWLRKNLTTLASFSAGIFVIVVWKNIGEALHELSAFDTTIAALVGFTAIVALHSFLPETHHHHDHPKHNHGPRGTWKLLIADGLHNIVDGIALTLAFATNTQLGILMGISILAHEFVQELGEYFALRSYGLSNCQALLRNFLVACTLLVGVVMGLVLSTGINWIEPWLLAVSAGIFAAIVLTDFIPSPQVFKTNGKMHILAFLVGALLLLGITSLAPHSHGEAEHGDHHPESIGDTVSHPSDEIDHHNH